MKKINYAFALLLLVFTAYILPAQRLAIPSDGNWSPSQAAIRTAGGPACDTVALGFPIPDPLVIYSSSGWGFASGHNDYGDLAFAERVANAQGFTQVLGIRFQFGFGASSGPNAKVTVRVWPEASGVPGAPLHSQMLAIDDIIAASGNTVVIFPSPVAVSGPFFVGFEVSYAAGDTVAVYTTTDSTVSPSTAWSKFSNGSWYPFDDGTNSWGLAVAQAIYPMVLVGNFQVTILPSNPTIPSGGQVQLSASGGFNHVWSPNTGLSCTNCSNPVANPAITTTYTVTAWDSTSSCSVTDTVTVTVTGVGIGNQSLAGTMQVFPNPSTGKVTLEFEDWKEARAQVSVVNSMGQVVQEFSLDGLVGRVQRDLLLADLAKGCYLLKVAAGQKSLTRRLILE
jgi:hypothetical protein